MHCVDSAILSHGGVALQCLFLFLVVVVHYHSFMIVIDYLESWKSCSAGIFLCRTLVVVLQCYFEL